MRSKAAAFYGHNSHKNRLNDLCNACLCHPFSGSGTFFIDGMKSSEKAQRPCYNPLVR